MTFSVGVNLQIKAIERGVLRPVRSRPAQKRKVRVTVIAVNILTSDADCQRQREAADRAGPEIIKDKAGDERTDVGVEDRGKGALETGVNRGAQSLAAPQLLFQRSKIRMLASTAIPIERINPAIPGSVSVIGMSLKSAKEKSV